MNDRGFHWHIQPEVEQRSLNFKKIRFPWGFRKTLNPKALGNQLKDVIQSNWQFWNLYKAYKPDVLHVGNESNIIALLPVLLLIKIPLVYRLGDKPSSHFTVHNFLWKYIICRRVTKFVCISNYIKNELVQINSNCDQAEVIYNVPVSRVTNKEEPGQELIPGFTTFIYIGQIEKIKGVDLLVEAFLDLCRDHHTIRLLLAGDIEHSSLAKELQQNVSESHHEDKVQFLGKINNIDELFSVGDVGIFPSVYEEPLSNVIGEAKKNFKPSIIFRSGGMPELVEHEKNGFIATTKDVEGIKKAGVVLPQKPCKNNRHGENAHRYLYFRS